MVIKPDYEQHKSFFYKLVGLLLLVGALCYNIFTVPLLQQNGVLPLLADDFPHRNDFLWSLPACSSVVMLVCGSIIWFAPRKMGWYFNESVVFNVFLLTGLFALLLTSNPVAVGHLRLLRVGLVLLLMFTVTNAFYQVAVKDRRKRELHPYYKNLALVFYTLCIMGLLLEGVFMFVSRPHRYNGTLASRNWFAHHWQVNALGYRDVEVDSAALAQKKVVLFAGDSFTAGHGVKDPASRFSDRVGAALGQSFAVANLGYPGADTRDEAAYLRSFPAKPALIVLAWYPNDIDQAGVRAGLELKRVTPYEDSPALYSFFVQRSYLLNFLYWLYPRRGENLDYQNYLKECFASDKVMALHQADLQAVIQYANENDAKLVVVLFPFLEDVKGSAELMQPVKNYLQAQQVPFIALDESLKLMEPAQMMVNKNDGHPNEKVHQLVADSLIALMNREGWTR